MSRIYGVETPLALEHIHSTLQAIFKHSFKTDLSQHVNAQRPGYAMGHEPGLLLCSWPRGSKPTLPFVYSDEVWTGIEYQVASHLMTLWIGPQLKIRPFKTFFCTAHGFGTLVLENRLLRIDLLEGELPLERLILTDGGQTKVLDWKTTVRADAPATKPT